MQIEYLIAYDKVPLENSMGVTKKNSLNFFSKKVTLTIFFKFKKSF